MERLDNDQRSAMKRRTAIRILLIDDDASDRERVTAVVRSDVVPVEIQEISDHIGFFQALKDLDFDLVITEQDVHWSSGAEVLTAIKSIKPTIPVIMVARFENEAIAAAALREGLEAYIPKSGELATRLRSSIRTALQKVEMADRAETVETRLQDLLDRLNVGVFRTTMDGRMLEANAAFLRLTGIPSTRAMRDTNFAEMFVDSAVRMGYQARVEESGQLKDFPVELSRRDGSTVWVSLTATVHPSLGGDGFVDGLLEDVTLARQAQQVLMPKGDDFRAVFEVTSAATVILDEDGTISVVNPSFERMSGFPREELEGRRAWIDFVVSADVKRVVEHLESLSRDVDAAPRTVRLDFINREGRVEHVIATMARLPKVRRLVVSMLNLTARTQMEEQLLHNAFHDELTGLPNRLSLLDRMEALLSDEGKNNADDLALVLFGLDRFRVINDCLGHRVGDLLLQAVTRRVERVVPTADTLARCSGDVFGLILCPAGGVDGATKTAESIAAILADNFTFGDHTVHCSASVGITTGGRGRDANDLYRDAEAAMYEAKRKGRGRWVVFEQSMFDKAWRAFTIENDLRRALSNHEFHLHYQPIGALSDGKILGFEALLRWWRPGGDLLLPDKFLSVAEESGLIVPIGREVLRLACEQLQRWRAREGAPDELFVSVNLTGRQLRNPKLAQEVQEAVLNASVQPSDLMLEVSECELTDEEAPILRVLEQLNELGVQLCIDSFGTGGLPLASLHRYPFTAVKIDRSFLAEIGDDSWRWRMVDGLNALAMHLGLKVFVEGIEERDQLHRLIEMGCNLGQGALLSVAVDVEGADGLLRAHPVW